MNLFLSYALRFVLAPKLQLHRSIYVWRPLPSFAIWLILIFLWTLYFQIVCLRAIWWSAVALHGICPACALWYLQPFWDLSLIILSYILPTLSARIIPLSLERSPFTPFPLYSLVMLPCNQLVGMVSFWCTWLIAYFSNSLVVGSASMNISLGIS